MNGRLALLASALLAAGCAAGPATATPMKGAAPKVWVILWFDTEDYLSPAAADFGRQERRAPRRPRPAWPERS